MGLYEGIKDVAKVLQQTDNIPLYQQLLDLSTQALELQGEVARLKAENAELKRQKDIESKIQRHDEPIVTLIDSDVIYCAHCWDNEKKLIQVSTNEWNGQFVCPHCNFNGIYSRDINNEYLKRIAPRGPRIKII